MRYRRNPELIAHIAAVLMTGRHDVEPHNVKTAVKAAHAIVDEAEATSVEAEETDEAAASAPAAEPAGAEPAAEPARAEGASSEEKTGE